MKEDNELEVKDESPDLKRIEETMHYLVEQLERASASANPSQREAMVDAGKALAYAARLVQMANRQADNTRELWNVGLAAWDRYAGANPWSNELAVRAVVDAVAKHIRDAA